MQRIVVECFWQYLSLSTYDTYVILYEIKAFYLVSDDLFSLFFTLLSKPQHLQKRKFNTASVRTSFLTAHPRRPRGSQSGRVKRRDESFKPVLSWKLLSRLFSRPDWPPLGLRGCLQPSALSEKCKIMSLSCAPHLHAVTQIETRDCSQFMNMKNPSLSISL